MRRDVSIKGLRRLAQDAVEDRTSLRGNLNEVTAFADDATWADGQRLRVDGVITGPSLLLLLNALPRQLRGS
jgi:hypothetical protein